MKFFKRSKEYRASNVSYSPATGKAYSYGWWLFVDRIDGLTVFNDYNYSNTTIRHQYKAKRLLEELGVNIDLTIKAPQGLQNLQNAVAYYEHEIMKLTDAIAKPRSKAAKNEERLELQAQYVLKIKAIHSLISKQAKRAA